MLQERLVTAEARTDFSDLPQAPYPMTRLRRTNPAGQSFMYVVANYNNIQYLVASRQSVQQHFPPRGVDALRITTEGAEGVTAMPNANTTLGLYSSTFVAIGGTQPYQYALVSVSDTNLLTGAAIDPDTGEFTGSPTAGGDVLVTVSVTDDNGTVAQKAFTLHIFTGA